MPVPPTGTTSEIPRLGCDQATRPTVKRCREKRMGDARYLMSVPTAAQTAAISDDPLLTLLQRYDAELAAFNDASGIAERDWDKLAENTWSRTQDEILERKPEATTAAGALLALDHVLKDELFADRSEFADQQMLWLL